MPRLPNSLSVPLTVLLAGAVGYFSAPDPSSAVQETGTESSQIEGADDQVFDEPRPRFVAQGDVPLFAAPSLDGAEPLAMLKTRAPVSVAEERQGWSRVVIWGWVPTETLADELQASSAPGTGPQTPRSGDDESEAGALQPDLDDFGNPLTDIAKATRISVSTRTVEDPDSDGAIGISVGLTDPRGRLVGFEGTPLTFYVSLYGKKVLPGGTTRGRKIYETRFTFDQWREGHDPSQGRCRIPFDAFELQEGDSEIGILVVRTRLPDGRFLFGRSYEVETRESSTKD